MSLAGQAAVEYAALAVQRATALLGREVSRARAFATQHFLVVLLVLLGFVVLLAFRSSSHGRRR